MSKIFNLAPYCSKKPKKEEVPHNRYGVYYDLDGWRVATNGFILAITKNGYDPEMAEKIITSKGEELEGRYPNWKSVIRSDIYCQFLVKIDIKEIEDAIADFKLRKKHGDVCETLDDCKIKIGEQAFFGRSLKLFVNHMKFAKVDTFMRFERFNGIQFKTEDNIGVIMPITGWEISDDPIDRLYYGEYEMKNVQIIKK